MLFDFFSIIKGLFGITTSYSNEVFKEPLSNEEELICIQNKMLGDKDARDKLIEHNLRLVAHIVKKFDSKYVDLDDLISIGTIGLIKGIDTFSLDKGVKLTTYAAQCIKNEVLMYFRVNNKFTKDVSINDTVGFDKDGNEIALVDVIKTKKVDFLEDLNTKDNITRLSKYFNILSDTEKDILVRRYGLNQQDEQTQKVIAKKLGISRSYVSRIEKRALTKLLREFIKNNLY